MSVHVDKSHRKRYEYFYNMLHLIIFGYFFIPWKHSPQVTSEELFLTRRPFVPTEMVRTATPFPMVSLLFVFTAFIISNIGHIRPQRTILAFVSGIFFILSGGTHHSFRAVPAPSHYDWLQQPAVSCVTHGDALLMTLFLDGDTGVPAVIRRSDRIHFRHPNPRV